MPAKRTITVAAVEGGGTSFRLAVCQFQDDDDSYSIDSKSNSLPQQLPPPARIVAQHQVDSSHNRPHDTLKECATFFREHLPKESAKYDALGIATFGPVGLSRSRSNDYGHILSTTPKAAWKNVDLVTPLQAACGCNDESVWVETDVNAPALAEYLLFNNNDDDDKSKNSRKKISSLAYVTVGTGVGVGLVVNDACVHGRMHPEGGHLPIIPLENDTFTGYSWGVDHCPFQGKCTVEGVASSVALTERLMVQQQQNGQHKQRRGKMAKDNGSSGVDRSILSQLSDDDETWDHASNALASLCASLLLMLSIERIVLGGGILKRPGLLDKIRQRTVVLLNGYLELPPPFAAAELEQRSNNVNNNSGSSDDETFTFEQLITTSVHGENAGLQGAIVLAQRAYYQGCRLKKEKDDEELIVEMKREAFRIGWTYGIMIGAVGTALVMKYAMTGGRRR